MFDLDFLPKYRFRLGLKFLAIFVPVFVALISPGAIYMSRHNQMVGHEDLAARFGGGGARSANALGRHGSQLDRRMMEDLMSALAIDPAFVYVEFQTKNGTSMASFPPLQGCNGTASDQEFRIPVARPEGSGLLVRFTMEPLRATERAQAAIVTVALGMAFAVALLTASVGLHLLVGKPPKRLIEAMKTTAETGRRQPISLDRKDELGIAAASRDPTCPRACRCCPNRSATFPWRKASARCSMARNCCRASGALGGPPAMERSWPAPEISIRKRTRDWRLELGARSAQLAIRPGRRGLRDDLCHVDRRDLTARAGDSRATAKTPA